MHAAENIEVDLIIRLRAGDRKALATLYERHKAGLYRYCLRLLKDDADAEDAVHATFLNVLQGAESLDRVGAFQAWLYRIARNEALMILRRARRASGGDLDQLVDEETPLKLLIARNREEAVQRALEELRVEYREVLVLREFEGLSYAEIAQVTDMTVDSVRSRIFKARKALSGRLETWLKERNVP